MSDNRTEERNDAFDSAMRERLSGYEPTVPHALWTRISAELNDTETEVKHTIPHHTSTPRWKIAIAAAIVITLGAGSLLYNFNPKNELSTNSIPASPAPTISPSVVSTTSAPASIASITAPAINVTTTQKATSIKNGIISPAIDNAIVNNTPATTEENQLASTPPTTENNPVELGNIPVYSLNKLTAPAQLNDEITVIKSSSVKKKHHRHSDEEESTKVIMLGKKYDSAPDIRYQVPVRF